LQNTRLSTTRVRNGLFSGLFALLFLTGCRSGLDLDRAGNSGSESAIVRTGAGVLSDEGFAALRGLRIGLIANQTARVDFSLLIDLLHSDPGIQLVALFGPEHGLRGSAEAGETVEDGTDSETGIPIYSLFGGRSAPDSTVLKDLDILVFDIQDVGARFYTYISTMGRAMQAAAGAGIPFLVLDRPNPLGGIYVDGYVLDPEFRSGVGLYPIPVQHGMTVGEIAEMIKGEEMLDGLGDLDLRVVRMQGWRRDMLWPDTGLEWIPTSPNIPTFETALVYAGTCFFEGTIASEGRGTDAPFLTLGAPWLNGSELAAELNSMSLAGVSFSSGILTPESLPGRSLHPRFEGQPFEALKIDVGNEHLFRPLEVGISVLEAAYRAAPDSIRDRFLNQRWLSLLAGTDRLGQDIQAGRDASEIVRSWDEEVSVFRNLRERYLLYH
jgi:uncharacterized protein YbbC (DUF1343 family)